MYAKKYLGQHFLKNKAKLRKIVDALEFSPKADQPQAEKAGDVVIEIGPGHGELTRLLAEKSKTQNPKSQIIAIEKDKELAEDLKEKFSQDKNIEIIHGDALKILPAIIHNSSFIIQNYKIVGNIPYYITGYLFRILGDLEQKPKLAVFLIQKEVAERVCTSPPHQKFGVGARPRKMNLLAASVQIWAEPKIIGYVSRKDFSPAPKVDSAIIRLRIMNYELGIMCSFSHSQECWNEQNKQNADDYYKFIKILFKQPRKTIVNNVLKFQGLKVSKEKIVEKLKELGVKKNARPQDLSIEQIVALSTLFS